MGAGLTFTQRVFLVLVALSAGAVSLSYLGRLHPIGDSLAVFRPWIVAALVLSLVAVLAVGPRARAAQAVGVIAFLLLGQTLLLGDAAPGPRAFTAYQKNLSFRLGDPEPLIADIRATAPDIVTLQEVDADNLTLLTTLENDFPSQHFCPFHHIIGGTAVLSRFPIIDGSQRCAEGGFTAMQVNAPTGPLWVVSIHLHWPWPHRQAEHLARLADDLAALDGDVLIGGDFNMVPDSYTLRRVGEITRTSVQSGKPATYHLKGWLGLPIDHVLHTHPCGRVERRPKLGSDHHGLLASLAGGC